MSDELFDESALYNETPEQAASRIIRENAPFAAQAIASMITDETVSATVRFRASQYVIDRILGPVSGNSGETNELEQFLQELNKEANRGHS